jgi:hypothetical protein
MMYHHQQINLLMVNHVHVLLYVVQDLSVEQNDNHINDMKISFLDYEYFEYDVEDWMKLKMIVHNICNDMAKTKPQQRIFFINNRK